MSRRRLGLLIAGALLVSAAAEAGGGQAGSFMEAPLPRQSVAAFHPPAGLGAALSRTLRTTFLDPADGLFMNFNVNGNFNFVRPNVYGPPYTFVNTGADKLSAWSAFAALALLHQWALQPEAALLGAARRTARSLHDRCRDAETGSYTLVCGDPQNEGAVTDAIVGSLYLRLAEIDPKGPYRGWAREVFDALLRNYVKPDGSIRCCRAGGRLVDEMYSRDALTVGALAQASEVVGAERYLAAATRLADVYLRDHYRDGHFTDWENLGTDSEMGLGLLVLAHLTREAKYRKAAETLPRYWKVHLSERPQSIVDMAEHVTFLERVAMLPGEDAARRRAREVFDLIAPCYNRRARAFPFMCGSDANFYSAINATALLCLP